MPVVGNDEGGKCFWALSLRRRRPRCYYEKCFPWARAARESATPTHPTAQIMTPGYRCPVGSGGDHSYTGWACDTLSHLTRCFDLCTTCSGHGVFLIRQKNVFAPNEIVVCRLRPRFWTIVRGWCFSGAPHGTAADGSRMMKAGGALSVNSLHDRTVIDKNVFNGVETAIKITRSRAFSHVCPSCFVRLLGKNDFCLAER